MTVQAIARGWRGRRAARTARVPLARIAEAFRREELFGIRLAAYARIIGVVVILIWVMAQNWAFGAAGLLYLLAVLVVFGGLIVVHLLLARSRARRPWQPYIFVLLDVALLTFVIAQPNPFHPYYDAIPPPVMLRFDNFNYYFVLLGSVVLQFSPFLILFFGAAASAAWASAVGWIMAQPGAYTVPDRPLSLDPAVWLRDLYNPYFVNTEDVVTELVTLCLSCATLALGVWRARLLVYRQTAAERERTNLARYFSPNLVDELARTDQPLGAPRQQDAAILFADIVGFTRLTEALAPEQTLALLRDYHGRMAEAVFAHGGTLDKYVGDEVMATFGTPRPTPHDGANALSCARAMQDALAAWNRTRLSRGEPEVAAGIGLHYGPVVLGDIGGEQRFEFAVIGDTVNVASRLERLTRTTGASIVASDALVRRVRHELGAAATPLVGDLRLDPVQAVRGRREAVDLWLLPRTPPQA
jgi:adenylate cyclase